MSQQNVEIVRAVNDAYNRGDFDAVRETAEPEFVLIPAGGQPPIKARTKFASGWSQKPSSPM